MRFHLSNPIILVIDDDPDLRSTLQAILEVEGYSVSGVSNGAEGLARLRRTEPPNLILLDLMMPVMDGFEFLERVKDLSVEISSIPILVLTAADLKLLTDPRLKLANGIIKKPFEVNLLIEQIETTLRQEHRPAA